MFIHKNIQPLTAKKADRSAQEIEELEMASIKHIRYISTELSEILDQISELEPSIVSPDFSSVTKKYKSGQSNYIGENKCGVIDLALFQKKNKKEEKANKAFTSIHYTTYMKPIHNIKQKIRSILQQQKQQRQIEEQRQQLHFETMKRTSIKNYSSVSPKYNKCQDKMARKNEAVANRMMELQLAQMQGVTFKPKINYNVEISQSFNQRLLNSYNRRIRKEAEIVKDMLKDQTHKPKTNAHNSESKVKAIWMSSSASRIKQSGSESFTDFEKLSRYGQFERHHQKSSHIKASLSQLEFMIDKRPFQP